MFEESAITNLRNIKYKKVECSEETDKQEYEQLKDVFFNNSRLVMSEYINKYI
jgi:hypothetical protein